MPDPIYLDHHATTPIDRRVLDAMLPYLEREFGNAASRTHAYGWRAEAAVDDARERVAAALGAESPAEIVFTSGATESNNLAIFGLAEAQRGRRHLITIATEHPAVLDCARELESRGFDLTVLPVDSEGRLSANTLAGAMREETFLVSAMAANNEIGVLHPVAEFARVCRERDVVFHTDAAQAVGKIDLDAARDGLDLLSVSGHKIYGPKGIGCLRVRKRGKPRLRLVPRQFGGGHEGGLRSGTLPVALIVGLARALEIALEDRAAEQARLAALRDDLAERLRSALGGQVAQNGHASERLAGNLNVSFHGVDGDRLLADLGGLAVSSGAACSSAKPEPSPVLMALGLEEKTAKASIRFGLGRETTAEEVATAAERVVAAVRAQTAAGDTFP